jgi:multicomponent Na+:H+ antiporter subunit B
MRMHEKIILRVTAKFFIPLILLFALYVQFHGDFGPGGGFQAGVIFAAAYVLYGLIFGLDAVKKVLPPAVAEAGSALGFLIYAGTGLVCMVRGANFLDYDVLHATHGQHYGILLVELGVGITVAATMAAMFYALAGRWEE